MLENVLTFISTFNHHRWCRVDRYFTADTKKLQEIFQCGHGIMGGVGIS